ncbi:hypothetical protein TU78_17780, partial [Pseudomonas taetrolens]
VLDAGASITLMAGGQHIVISAAGIYSSSPIVPGGVPVPGTPANPLLPGESERLLAPQALPAPLASYQQRLMTSTHDSGVEFCPLCEACENAMCLPEGGL